MDSNDICFSPGAIALLGACWAIIQGAIVTLFWLLIRSKNDQIAKSESRELEWRRVAIRGANDIIPPLVSVARAQIADQVQGLREPS